MESLGSFPGSFEVRFHIPAWRSALWACIPGIAPLARFFVSSLMLSAYRSLGWGLFAGAAFALPCYAGMYDVEEHYRYNPVACQGGPVALMVCAVCMIARLMDGHDWRTSLLCSLLTGTAFLVPFAVWCTAWDQWGNWQ